MKKRTELGDDKDFRRGEGEERVRWGERRVYVFLSGQVTVLLL